MQAILILKNTCIYLLEVTEQKYHFKSLTTMFSSQSMLPYTPDVWVCTRWQEIEVCSRYYSSLGWSRKINVIDHPSSGVISVLSLIQNIRPIFISFIFWSPEVIFRSTTSRFWYGRKRHWNKIRTPIKLWCNTSHDLFLLISYFDRLRSIPLEVTWPSFINLIIWTF